MKNFKYLFLILFTLTFISCKKEKLEEIVRPAKIQEINYNNNISRRYEYSSQLSPVSKTNLAFKVAGTIKEIKYESGELIKEGQEIASMDTVDYKLNLEVFKKKYEAAKAVANNANQQFARADKLYKAGALSKKDYDNAIAQKTVAISTFKEATSGLENAKNTLKYTNILAPYDGYIDKKISDVGSVVAAGTPVLTFISNDISNVEINVSLDDIENIKKAENIFFKSPKDEKEYKLKIKNIAQSPDITNLTYSVVLTFEEPDSIKNFVAGETGNVIVNVVEKGSDEILLPIEAIFSKDKSNTNVYLYVDGKAVLTEVKITKLTQSNKIKVVSGLKNGDKVIVAGVSKLFDGEKVRLLDEKNNLEAK